MWSKAKNDLSNLNLPFAFASFVIKDLSSREGKPAPNFQTNHWSHILFFNLTEKLKISIRSTERSKSRSKISRSSLLSPVWQMKDKVPEAPPPPSSSFALFLSLHLSLLIHHPELLLSVSLCLFYVSEPAIVIKSVERTGRSCYSSSVYYVEARRLG